MHLARRDYEAAAAAYGLGVQLGDRTAARALPFAHHLNGLDSQALEAWIRLSALEISTGETEMVLREAYARGSLEGATAAYLEALASRDGTPCTTTAHGGARMLALMGDSDRMLACLDQSIEEHDVDWLAKVHPIYDPYRDDPRFQAHLRRIGL